MPLCEYRCNEFGRRFDLLVGVVAEKVELRCPRCGSRRVTKLVSRIAPVARRNEFDDQEDSDFDDEDSKDYEDDYDDF